MVNLRSYPLLRALINALKEAQRLPLQGLLTASLDLHKSMSTTRIFIHGSPSPAPDAFASDAQRLQCSRTMSSGLFVFLEKYASSYYN